MRLQIVKLSREEYIEVKHKAELYDELTNKRVAGGKKAASKLTKEQRVERARKAAQARWSK